MQPSPRTPGHWDTWKLEPMQHSTDALANWEAKVKAKVDWIESSDRRSNNEIKHTVIPYLTCAKCHALPDPRHDAYPLTFDFVNQNHMSIMSEQVTRQWVDRHPAYELVGYWPRVGWDAGRQIVSILVCYRLNYLPITDCFGEGRSLKAAKAQAAEKLLKSGHCMVHLS
ncbi:unnamed protein product [Rhizoctonia solani]|uniref:Uncharacterized protein n=1 Tax=Rhizoctonia solani TaxID=456999 RepID=A0A8H3BP31_9AGAM|nr:unnamed protein product [Rhizoctonia solani]